MAVGELEEVGDGREQRHLATYDGVREGDDGDGGRTGPPSSTPWSRVKKMTMMEPLDVFSGAGEVGARSGWTGRRLSGGSDEDDQRQRLKEGSIPLMERASA